jgi:DnaJ-class molecular chaperone
LTSTKSIENIRTEGKNYYEVLECTKECTFQEIKKNYRDIALKYHPDKISINATDEDREIFKTYFLFVQLAYETLSDEERRLQYDLSFQGLIPIYYIYSSCNNP